MDAMGTAGVAHRDVAATDGLQGFWPLNRVWAARDSDG